MNHLIAASKSLEETVCFPTGHQLGNLAPHHNKDLNEQPSQRILVNQQHHHHHHPSGANNVVVVVNHQPELITVTPRKFSHTTKEQRLAIIAWLEIPENFSVIIQNSNNPDAQRICTADGKKVKKTDAYRSLAAFVNRMTGSTTWDAKVARSRYESFVLVYRKTIKSALKEDFATISQSDREKGVENTVDKLNFLCPYFFRINRLYQEFDLQSHDVVMPDLADKGNPEIRYLGSENDDEGDSGKEDQGSYKGSSDRETLPTCLMYPSASSISSISTSSLSDSVHGGGVSRTTPMLGISLPTILTPISNCDGSKIPTPVLPSFDSLRISGENRLRSDSMSSSVSVDSLLLKEKSPNWTNTTNSGSSCFNMVVPNSDQDEQEAASALLQASVPKVNVFEGRRSSFTVKERRSSFNSQERRSSFTPYPSQSQSSFLRLSHNNLIGMGGTSSTAMTNPAVKLNRNKSCHSILNNRSKRSSSITSLNSNSGSCSSNGTTTTTANTSSGSQYALASGLQHQILEKQDKLLEKHMKAKIIQGLMAAGKSLDEIKETVDDYMALLRSGNEMNIN